MIPVKYHKIPTVYERDPTTNHKTLLVGKFATPELKYLASQQWSITEKVDGTNIRIHWDGEAVHFGGRTDNAQLPVDLINSLAENLSPEQFRNANCGPMVLFGEGYGPKIQKGGVYGDHQQFVLFDVFVKRSTDTWADGIWLERHNVEGIGDNLGLRSVPIYGVMTLFDMVRMAFDRRHDSHWGNFPPEGYVARPLVELQDRRGQRIITKIKYRDFGHSKTERREMDVVEMTRAAP